MLEFFIAKKHILEKKKQSLIGILGITIGITVLMVSIGIANGLDKNMINSILSLGSHITISNLQRDEENYKSAIEKLEKIEGVKSVIPKVATQGIIKYTGTFGTHVSGVKVDGLDFERASKGLELQKKIVYGSINTEKKNTILIGKELFNQLGADIGDKITLVSAENQELPLEIGGVFESGYYDYDVNMVIIPLATTQYLMYMGDEVTSLELTLADPYKAEQTADKIFDKYGYMSRTWGEQNRNLLSALALEKTVMIIVFSLIVVIAGFVVWVIMNMLVREKIKDIGIMRAMGFPKKTIMRIFLLEGMTLGGIGIFAGTLLSLGILWYVENYSIAGITSIYYLTKIPVELSGKEIITIIFVNIIIIFLSSVFHAYRAGNMETMEALRHE